MGHGKKRHNKRDDYGSSDSDSDSEPPSPEDFKEHFCGLTMDCCCPCLMFAKAQKHMQTNGKEDTACNTWLCIWCLSSWVPAASSYMLLMQRHHIRSRYHLVHHPVHDTAVSCCCLPCTAQQDWHEVKRREKRKVKDEKTRVKGERVRGRQYRRHEQMTMKNSTKVTQHFQRGDRPEGRSDKRSRRNKDDKHDSAMDSD